MFLGTWRERPPTRSVRQERVSLTATGLSGELLPEFGGALPRDTDVVHLETNSLAPQCPIVSQEPPHYVKLSHVDVCLPQALLPVPEALVAC